MPAAGHGQPHPRLGPHRSQSSPAAAGARPTQHPLHTDIRIGVARPATRPGDLRRPAARPIDHTFILRLGGTGPALSNPLRPSAAPPRHATRKSHGGLSGAARSRVCPPLARSRNGGQRAHSCCCVRHSYGHRESLQIFTLIEPTQGPAPPDSRCARGRNVRHCRGSLRTSRCAARKWPPMNLRRPCGGRSITSALSLFNVLAPGDAGRKHSSI